jgi:hypothetical protein
MSAFRDGYVKTSFNGVTHKYLFDDDGNLTVTSMQDVEPVLEVNKAQANAGISKGEDGDMWHAARIPASLILKWKLEEDLDVFDPEQVHRVAAKLNSSEFLYLRTGHFQL